VQVSEAALGILINRPGRPNTEIPHHSLCGWFLSSVTEQQQPAVESYTVCTDKQEVLGRTHDSFTLL
jgi:hypothetical protein